MSNFFKDKKNIVIAIACIIIIVLLIIIIVPPSSHRKFKKIGTYTRSNTERMVTYEYYLNYNTGLNSDFLSVKAFDDDTKVRFELYFPEIDKDGDIHPKSRIILIAYFPKEVNSVKIKFGYYDSFGQNSDFVAIIEQTLKA